MAGAEFEEAGPAAGPQAGVCTCGCGAGLAGAWAAWGAWLSHWAGSAEDAEGCDEVRGSGGGGLTLGSSDLGMGLSLGNVNGV